MAKSTVTNMTRGVYRRIYAGFITGRRICSVSEQAEAWFWRVNGIADDFGNGPADPHLVWTLAKGYRRVTQIRATRYMNELYAANLLAQYEAEGEHYFHIVDFLTFQPAARSGRRVRRYPTYPLESGEVEAVEESGGIRGNPESSGGIRGPETETEDHSHNHSETESETHDHAKTTAAPGSVSGKVSQGFSGSGSLSQDVATERLKARLNFHHAASKLWSRDTSQRKSDDTSTLSLFDDYLWPSDAPPDFGRAAIAAALLMIPKAGKNGNKPMAWFTSEIKKLTTAAGGAR